MGCRIKANCPFVRPVHVRGVPSMRVFLRDPNPYLREFQKKTLKDLWDEKSVCFILIFINLAFVDSPKICQKSGFLWNGFNDLHKKLRLEVFGMKNLSGLSSSSEELLFVGNPYFVWECFGRNLVFLDMDQRILIKIKNKGLLEIKKIQPYC